MRVLIVDDDKYICELLRLYLEKAGYETQCAYDGVVALEKFSSYQPDFVLLDIMLPLLDGWRVCKQIREKSDVPIIMLTARGETEDKISGLELGADDYVTKPFEPKEVIARMKAVMRRKQVGEYSGDGDAIRLDGMKINLAKYELEIDGKSIYMPPKELELLHYLASNPNRVFTRDQLLDQVWGFDYMGDSRTVDVHIKRLRDKLEGISPLWALKTVWGVGYKFEVL